MAGELKADPRTGLEIIDVPPQHAKYFSDLKGSLIHWFGVVEKYNRLWKPQKRVAVLSDQCIYLCRLDGGITRCMHMQAIQELILGEGTAIGFRVGPPDYDMLLTVDSVQDRESVVHIVSKVFWSLIGHDIVIRRLSGDSGEAMHQNLNLTKPKDWVLKIEPLKSTKALSKLLLEKQKKEDEDKRVVQEEFERIKGGLRAELQRYRSEEYDLMVDQLSQYVKALEERDAEIAHLKETSVSLDDPEVWRKCPNCAQLRRVLESHPNDDKQKVLRLEREIESQRHIVEHLQAAIQHRSGAASKLLNENASESNQIAVLNQELATAQRKNKELQQLVLDSPFLTSDVKQKADRLIATNADQSVSIDRTGGTGSKEVIDVIAEKDREIRHLKSVLRDASFRQVQELESIRAQFHKYDTQIIEYLEKVFAGQIRPSGLPSNPRDMAVATAEAAKHAATPLAFPSANADPAADNYLLRDRDGSASTTPFRQFVPPAGSAERAGASANDYLPAEAVPTAPYGKAYDFDPKNSTAAPMFQPRTVVDPARTPNSTLRMPASGVSPIPAGLNRTAPSPFRM